VEMRTVRGEGSMWWLSCGWEGERRLEGRSSKGELVCGCC
jgi:hypothetical protein